MANTVNKDEAPSILLPCAICSRTFKPESFEKHIKICEKNATKKRKIFDSSKQRIQGTDLAEFLPTILHNKKVEKVTREKPESNWKEKHLEFVRAIRAARGITDGPSNKNAPVVQSRPSNHEKCPHCDRNFGPKAFDRHIEWCKEQKARIPKSPASQQAKERLEARTKYRAPPLAKSKRTLTREKYAKGPHNFSQDLSPMGSRSAISFSNPPLTQHMDMKSPVSNAKQPVIRNKAKCSTSSPSCVLQQGNSQIRKRESSLSPSKRITQSGSKNSGGRITQVKVKNNDIADRENLFSSSCSITKIQPSNEGHPEKGIKSNIQQNSSTEEMYDPYVSAERQMLELLAHGDCAQPSLQTKQIASILPDNAVLPSFESSPRSAFVKYNSKESLNIPQETIMPSSLIAEFEDLFISGSSKAFPEKDITTEDNNRNISYKLSNLNLNFTNNNIETTNKHRKPSKIRAKMESASLSLQRSVSLMNYENENINVLPGPNVLTFSEKNNIPYSSEFEFSSVCNPDSGSFPELSLKSAHLEKESSCHRISVDKGNLEKTTILSSNESSQVKNSSSGCKFSADSAYGSLNRHTPTPTGSHMSEKNIPGGADPENYCPISSSSSESSLPPLCSMQVVKPEASSCSSTPPPALIADTTTAQQTVSRMSKFCHECGSKYPVPIAKFCCECGVRRLAM